MRGYRTPFEAGLSPFPDEAVSPSLGFDLSDAAITYGANAIVPGSGTAYAFVQQSGVLDKIFGGGAATDARRLERVKWTLDLAQKGSVTAAKVILEAPNNVGSNERPMWEEARSLIPPDVLQAAYEDPRQVWITGMPEFYNNPASSLYRAMTSEAANANQGGLPAIVQQGTQFVTDLFKPAGGQVVFGPDGRPVAQPAGVPWGLLAAGAAALLVLPKLLRRS